MILQLPKKKKKKKVENYPNPRVSRGHGTLQKAGVGRGSDNRESLPGKAPLSAPGGKAGAGPPDN